MHKYDFVADMIHVYDRLANKYATVAESLGASPVRKNTGVEISSVAPDCKEPEPE